MNLQRWASIVGMIAVAGYVTVTAAQGGAARQGGAPPPSGQARVGGTPIPGSNEPPKSIFREGWTRGPMAQPITQENLGNQHLMLHIYGDATQIRKAMHPLDDYTYTGETTTHWALTVSDKANLWDVTRGGKLRVTTQNTGFRKLHVVIRTADGKYFASEEGAGESSVFIDTDLVFQDMHWRNLLMTDTPSNASNRRQPDPKRVPIIPTTKATPDLTQIDEVGFSDLMEGGWIPATSRVKAFELFGKVVPRKQ